MKRNIVLFPLLLAMFIGNAQEKKPILMILPSDNWCTLRYYTTTFEDQGRKVWVCDYQRAFQEDIELGPTISKVGQVMTELGYSLKDSEQELKNIATRTAEDENTMSKSGSSLAESPLDALKKRSKTDIIIQLGWQVNSESKGKSITFTMEAFDAYTSKRIATATGTSKPSKDILPRILANCVKEQIKPFDAQLTKWFDGLRMNGREILLTVKRWNGWDKDLETEYNGEELLDCIQGWLRTNTIKGNFNFLDATENFAQFEQVRIPLKNEKGEAMDARAFATGLRKYLQKAPYNITSKVMTRGLGEAIIVLGEK